MANAAVRSTFGERLEAIGGIAAVRVRLSPAPGAATVDDLISANMHSKPLCELIDQTLVEKVMRFKASVVAVAIARILGNFGSGGRLSLGGRLRESRRCWALNQAFAQPSVGRLD